MTDSLIDRLLVDVWHEAQDIEFDTGFNEATRQMREIIAYHQNSTGTNRAQSELTGDGHGRMAEGVSSEMLLLRKAYEAYHFYVHASNAELLDRGMSRTDALNAANNADVDLVNPIVRESVDLDAPLAGFEELDRQYEDLMLLGLERRLALVCAKAWGLIPQQHDAALPGAFAISDAFGLPAKTIVEGNGLVKGICSNKPRPSLQNNHSKGSEHWKGDPWHIRASGTSTLCGIDSSEWLNIGLINPDHNLCQRCAKKAQVTYIEGGAS